MRDSTAAVVAAHHFTHWRWPAAGFAAWIVASLFDFVTIPAMLPHEDPRTFITSEALAGLILPLAICAVVLDEGPPALIASAGRRLGPSRLAWATAYVACMTASTWLESCLVPIETGTFVADGLFAAALTAGGVGLLGLRGGWLVPAVVIGSFGVPGLIPWSWNWVYRTDRHGPMTAIALIATAIGIAVFTAGGSRGLLARGSRLGTRADADTAA